MLSGTFPDALDSQLRYEADQSGPSLERARPCLIRAPLILTSVTNVAFRENIKTVDRLTAQTAV